MARKSRKAKARKEMKYSSIDTYMSKQVAGGKSLAFDPPSGSKLWRPKKKGNVKMEIVPYECGTDNPHAEEGMYHWELTYYVHRDVGPGKHSFICPLENYGKQCPICDQNAKLRRDPDVEDDELNFPKKRQLFNVFVHGEEDDGVQLFEYSFHQFGKKLVEELELAEDDNKKDFYHVDKSGMTLVVGFKENPPYGYEVARIDFTPRRKPLDASIVEQAYNLEEIVKGGLKPYKKIKALFLQTPDDKEEDDDEIEEDEELEDDDIEDDEDEIDEDEDLDDEEDDEEDDDEFEDDEDDDEEDDEDDEPPKKKSSKSKSKSKPKAKPKKSTKKSKAKSKSDDDEEEEDDDDEDWYDDDDDDDDESWG